METQDLENYREILLRHSRHPLRHAVMTDATATGECRNPLCGDHVAVSLKVVDETIAQIRIQVSGCGIATASASLMTEIVEGISLSEAQLKLRLALDTLSLAPSAEIETRKWPDSIAALRPFETLAKNPRKIPCALMGWFALKDALQKSLPTYS